MERRKIIGAAVFSAAIAGGGIAGVVLGSPTSSSAATASGSTTTSSTPSTHGMGRKSADLDAAAKAIGISTDTLLSDLQSGKTIAQIATAKGVAVSTVIAAMVAAAKADFDSDVTKRITDAVNGTFKRPFGPGEPGGGPQRGFGFRGGFGLDAAAKAIGVSTDSLEQDLKDGKTIAAVAKSKGVAVKTVVDAMVASAKAEFASQVKAGNLTADQAAKIEADLSSMITNLVNGTLPHPDGGPGGHGGFGGPGGYGSSRGGGSGQTSTAPAGLNA